MPFMLTSEQRRWRADKLGDLANYIIGALLIAQILSGNFHFGQTLIGIALTLICFFYADRQMKRLH
jgi:hypothetical protein